MDNTLNIGTIIKSPNYDYKILNVLGQGAFGITYLAETSVVTTTIIEGPLGNVSNKKATTMQVAIKEFFMKDICGRNNDGSIVDSSSSPLVSDYRKSFIVRRKTSQRCNTRESFVLLKCLNSTIRATTLWSILAEVLLMPI